MSATTITQSKLTAEQRLALFGRIASGLLATGNFSHPGAPDCDESGVATARLIATANGVLAKLEETL
jgi:hypothetical protein